MGINPIYLSIHGHFYQPPRENPWTGLIELQESAAPNHDWNERIAEQCYAPNGTSRILSANGRIERIVNNYSYMSFNIGPTLMNWIRVKRPDVYSTIQAGDMLSAERLDGHGNAIAQVYNHIIMPLADERDKLTQIRWGIRDFEFHFNRKPEGMWLAETAINMATVVALIKEGIKFTILSPQQAASFRALSSGKTGAEWTDCSNGSIDTKRPYRIIPRDKNGKLICEGHLDVFFYDAELSTAVSFEHLLRDASNFGNRILKTIDKSKTGSQIISVGTDGESYGHHESFGDMCAAWFFDKFCPANNIVPVNYGWYLEKHAPEFEVQLKNASGEGSAWSCAHGVGRWSRDCGCSTGGGPDWNQKWREPLRKAFDHVKETADEVFEREFSLLSNMDCWKARDEYIEVMLESENHARKEEFASAVLNKKTCEDDKSRFFSLLEIQKFCLYSYTSCGWFFNDIEGLEPVQNMRYCMRALELLKQFLPDSSNLESEILTILSTIKSNEHGKTGTEIWTEWVRPKIPIPYIQMATEAAKYHLKLSHQAASHIEISSIKNKDNQIILNATCTNQDTFETKSASLLITSDSIGRVIIVLQTDNSRQELDFAEEHSINQAYFKKQYPKAFIFRLHDLPQDVLAEINLAYSFVNISTISKYLLEFSEKFGMNYDCLADRSESLIAPLRQSMTLNFTIKMRQLAIEALYNDSVSASTLEKIKELKDEFETLKVPIKHIALDDLFKERFVKLISRIQETQNQSIEEPDHLQALVDKLNELVTIAEWLHLNINKSALETQSYGAYLLYKKKPEKYAVLKPMFEWMNFDI
jgi:alpha-amylase/alpha-mannosidase (GH57 family)